MEETCLARSMAVGTCCWCSWLRNGNTCPMIADIRFTISVWRTRSGWEDYSLVVNVLESWEGVECTRSTFPVYFSPFNQIYIYELSPFPQALEKLLSWGSAPLTVGVRSKDRSYLGRVYFSLRPAFLRRSLKLCLGKMPIGLFCFFTCLCISTLSPYDIS